MPVCLICFHTLSGSSIHTMTDITFSIADYPEIRNRGIFLNTKIYEKLTPEDIKTCACNLDVWVGNALGIDSDEEMNIFADYAIYGYRPNGFNMAEKFLRLFHNEADDFELALLRYMRSAHYVIYQVEETNGVDTFNVVDIYNKAQYKIIDFKLAKSTFKGEIFASHLIDFEGFSIQTGGALIMAPEILGSDVMKQLIEFMKDAYPGDFLSYPEIGALLAKNMATAGLKLGERAKLGRVKF